jgi:hypothetical protein
MQKCDIDDHFFLNLSMFVLIFLCKTFVCLQILFCLKSSTEFISLDIAKYVTF